MSVAAIRDPSVFSAARMTICFARVPACASRCYERATEGPHTWNTTLRAMEPAGSTIDAGVHICLLAADLLVDWDAGTTGHETHRRFSFPLSPNFTGFGALGCNSTEAGRALRLRRSEEQLCTVMAHAGAALILVLSRASPRLGAWTRFPFLLFVPP